MEENERPRKLRKLSHGDEADYVGPADADTELDSVAPTTQTAQNAEVNQTANGSSNPEIDPVNDSATLSRTVEGVRSSTHDEEVHHDTATAPQPLSKNQRKKLKRREEWEAGREDRKAKRKEKAKEKKARKRVERAETRNGQQRGAYHVPQHRHRSRHLLPVAFVIDCSFDSLMNEKELISLGSQLTRAYSDNTKAYFQAHLYVSSWTLQTDLRKRFEGLLKGMYKRWKGVKFVEDDFVGASARAETAMKGSRGGTLVGAFEKYEPLKQDINQEIEQQPQQAGLSEGDMFRPTDEQHGSTGTTSKHTDHDIEDPSERNNQEPSTPSNPSALMAASEVIYLTSDSPYTLTELKPYHTYIIGGIVDKNRHKGICYKTALDANTRPQTRELLGGKDIQTAKLPIGEYMSMSSRQVLATNHVVEIMLRWLEHGDWGRAFSEVMPKRKGAILKESGQNANGNGNENGNEDAGGEGEDVQSAEEAVEVGAEIEDDSSGEDSEEVEVDPDDHEEVS